MAMPEYSTLNELLQYLNAEANRVISAITAGTLGEEDFSVDINGNPIDRDSPLTQIYQTIIGRANEVPPEIANDTSKLEVELRRIFLAEVGRINQEIDNAGGFDQWLAQQEDSEAEPERNVFQEILDEAAEAGEEITEEEINVAQEIIKTVKGSIPTNLDDLKDLIQSVLTSTVGVSKDCETWTGRVGEGEGGSGSVPGSGSGTYQGWKDCVNIGAIFSIPGLDIPMPPGIVDITWKDLEDAVREAGQDIKDVISDPGGWLEDAAEKAKEKVRKVLTKIKGGISDKDLEDIIRDAVGGSIGVWIGGYIQSSIEEEIEEAFPNLFITDPNETEECVNGAVNYPECNECPKGFFFSEKTQQCEPTKQAPIGPTEEECAEQNRAHIPAGKGGTDRCGGCLSGYEANEGGDCVETLEPCSGKQIRNETTGKCEDPPPDFEEGGPCKDDLGVDGTYDANGDCIADPEPGPGNGDDGDDDDSLGFTGGEVIEGGNDFGMCPDGITPKADKQGTNCSTITLDPCENPDYAQANPEECQNFLTPQPEPEPEPEPEPQPQPSPEPEPEPGEEETCANGAADWPLCSECADDTKPSDHEGGRCPGPVVPVEPPVEPPEPSVPSAGGGGGGRRSSPFMTGLNYQLPMLQQIIAPPPRDYSAGLLSQPKPVADYNRALGGVIANSLQKRKKGMFDL